MAGEGIEWRVFEWRCGSERYRFEISAQGERGILNIAGSPVLELPMLAWKALFEAIGMRRHPGDRGARYQPPRAGAAWSEEEDGRLVAAFRTGRLLADIARTHARTEVAIASRLVILGLAHRSEFPHLNRGSLPVDEAGEPSDPSRLLAGPRRAAVASRQPHD